MFTTFGLRNYLRNKKRELSEVRQLLLIGDKRSLQDAKNIINLVMNKLQKEIDILQQEIDDGDI